VFEADAPLERDAVGDALAVEEGVPVALRVPVPVALLLGVPLVVALALREVLPVLEGDAPLERDAVGDGETVVLPLRVVVAESEEVPVGVAVPVPVIVLLGVCGAVALALRELEPVLEADAPEESDGVGDELVAELPLRVVEGVTEAVPVPVLVGVTVGVPLLVELAVTLLLNDAEPVLEDDAPAVSEGVGDELVVLLALNVDEGVMDAVPVPDPVDVGVGDPVGV